MNLNIQRAIGLLGWLALAMGAGAEAPWHPVGEGIDYRVHRLADPNVVHVARLARARPEAIIDSSLPRGRLTGERETVGAQARRQQDAINSWGGDWGERNEVVVAINGDWSRLDSGLMHGGQMHAGWLAKGLHCEFGGAHFAWTRDRVPFIGGRLELAGEQIMLDFGDGELAVDGLNRARGTGEIILYTPPYGENTRSEGDGVEVRVELAQPLAAHPPPAAMRGRVVGLPERGVSTPIRFDEVVVSASGARAAELLALARPGREVGISIRLSAGEAEPLDWSRVYSGIGGGRVLVAGGLALDHRDDRVYAGRHPRTAVAFNDDYVFFVVCDGRSDASRGMSAMELSCFLIDELGATEALNLDGGGSSTMLVRGEVVNRPSDGRERAVGNGLMMINRRPPSWSARFSAGQTGRLAGQARVRRGPGENYGSLAEAAGGSPFTILPHRLNGIAAHGRHWWKAAVGGTAGWIAEPELEMPGTE